MGWLASSGALGAMPDDGLGDYSGARAWVQRRQSAQTVREAKAVAVPTRPQQRAQLLAMERREQQARAALEGAGVDPDPVAVGQLRAVDAAHAARLRTWLA